MTDPKIIDKTLIAINEKYPDHLFLKEYFHQMYGNDESQHNQRRELTEILFDEELVKTTLSEPNNRTRVIITPKGQGVVKQGGFEQYLHQKTLQTTIQKEIEELSLQKLRYDVANSKRIFKTYWLTFGIAIAGLVISLVLLVLKLAENGEHKSETYRQWQIPQFLLTIQLTTATIKEAHRKNSYI